MLLASIKPGVKCICMMIHCELIPSSDEDKGDYCYDPCAYVLTVR